MLVYEEQVNFKIFFALLVVFLAITFFFIFISYAQFTGHELNQDHGPFGFNLFMALFFLVLTFVVLQFKVLTIIITDTQFLAKYGIFKRVIDRTHIEDAYIDQANPFWTYGGWGIRYARYKGKKRFVYNLPNTPRVVLSLRGTNHEFVFSTEHPEKIIQILKS